MVYIMGKSMKQKVIDFNKIEDFADQLHAEGKRIVFTNGCFDIIHSGHVRYLKDASNLGDILILGLNSDSSVKRLKGSERPINSEEDRLIVLSALEMIDYLVVFEEDTPLSLIEKIRPNVIVKGGDWSVEQIVGSDFVISNGGTVRSLPYHQGRSTTEIIDKINKL